MKNHLHTNLEKYFIANCVCACVRKSVEKYVFPIQRKPALSIFLHVLKSLFCYSFWQFTNYLKELVRKTPSMTNAKTYEYI